MFPDMTRVATELNKVVIGLQQTTHALGLVRDELFALRETLEREKHENSQKGHKAE